MTRRQLLLGMAAASTSRAAEADWPKAAEEAIRHLR